MSRTGGGSTGDYPCPKATAPLGGHVRATIPAARRRGTLTLRRARLRAAPPRAIGNGSTAEGRRAASARAKVKGGQVQTCTSQGKEEPAIQDRQWESSSTSLTVFREASGQGVGPERLNQDNVT